MKYYLAFAFLFLSYVTFGQSISYTDWKIAASSDIRLLPKYGNVPKTLGQKQADEKFIKSAIKENGTSRKASDNLVLVGFDYLYRKDLKTAMSRFNQAWLLDSKNENVFWGFGAIYFTFHDFQNGLKEYEEGLKLNPKSTNILTDKATVYMTAYKTNQNESDYNEAIKLFKQSYSIDPKNQNTLFKLSVCYFDKHDCSNALKYYDECKKLGGKPISKEYTEALIQGCKR